jgi:transglutaminase-like putative cysteine protease
MKVRITSRLHYLYRSPATLVLNFRASSKGYQTILSESVVFTPATDSELIVTLPEQNRFDRLRNLQGDSLDVSYQAEVEVTHLTLDPESLRAILPSQLDPSVLPFLFPSRYCQSDTLGRFAWQKFGKISSPYDQVQEVTNWISSNVEYLPGSSSSTTSTSEVLTQCAGVCRDFAHLGISLCRALNVPARYFTGYSCQLRPPDFHACFEAFIGGHWILFDATKLVPLDGLIRIGSGRDAADVSVCTSFGIVSPGVYEIECLLDPAPADAPQNGIPAPQALSLG